MDTVCVMTETCLCGLSASGGGKCGRGWKVLAICRAARVGFLGVCPAERGIWPMRGLRPCRVGGPCAGRYGLASTVVAGVAMTALGLQNVDAQGQMAQSLGTRWKPASAGPGRLISSGVRMANCRAGTCFAADTASEPWQRAVCWPCCPKR